MLQETDYDRDDDPNALPNNESDSSEDDDGGDDPAFDDDENNWNAWNSDNELVGPMANLDVAETDSED